jgi:hypothetical protein
MDRSLAQQAPEPYANTEVFHVDRHHRLLDSLVLYGQTF